MSKQKMIFGHQGDVSFRPVVGDLPKGFTLGEELKVEGNGGITLVKGELTGHHHQFREPDKVKVYPMISETLNKSIEYHLVMVLEETKMEHFNVLTNQETREHRPITFPPGNYVIGNQREVNNYNDVIRSLD